MGSIWVLRYLAASAPTIAIRYRYPLLVEVQPLSTGFTVLAVMGSVGYCWWLLLAAFVLPSASATVTVNPPQSEC